MLSEKKGQLQFVVNKAKGRISKRVYYKKTKYAKFSEKRTFLILEFWDSLFYLITGELVAAVLL